MGKSLFDLTGRVAIVTGAGRGLGAAMVKGLADAGAKVAVADIDLDLATAVADEICKKGGDALPVKVNVADADSVSNMVSAVVKRYGTIDILVNNAGINRRALCIEMSEQDWDAVINVNLKGTWLCSRAVAPIMIKNRKGKVINIASIMGTIALPERGPYASTKGAVIQLTKVLALEWAPYNINVNAVGPGYFMTEMNTALKNDPETYAKLTSKVPMGRWADPEELVGPIVFLASDASSYLTGQTIFVDGGYICE